MYALSILMLASIAGYSSQQNASLPVLQLPLTRTSTCPSVSMRETIQRDIESQVNALLQDRASGPPCACGGAGEWTRLAYLNMSDSSQQCPPNWNLMTFSSKRGCARSVNSGGCNSASFPSAGRSYSHVCGRVNAYQKGSTDAFGGTYTGSIEEAYLEGVSLTIGASGSRQHIWSFASALYENDPSFAISLVCSCTNRNFNWPYQVPSFVGNNYFCATGNPGPQFDYSLVYSNDPLWDGEGCGVTNTCCEFNNPPWFCTALPQPSTEDLEVRICGDQAPANEDVVVSLIDIYVQ